MSETAIDIQDDNEYIVGDPIFSSDLTSLMSPSRSPHTNFTISTGDRSGYTSGIQVQDDVSPFPDTFLSASERDPLLTNVKPTAPRKKPFYRPRPLWYVSLSLYVYLCLKFHMIIIGLYRLLSRHR